MNLNIYAQIVSAKATLLALECEKEKILLNECYNKTKIKKLNDVKQQIRNIIIHLDNLRQSL